MVIGFVYKWTNQITSEWYIGSHKGTTNDGYRHSSSLLAFAEKKYGLENFIRKILFEGDYDKDKIRSVIEANYLHEKDAANNPMSYNQTNNAGLNCHSDESNTKRSQTLKGNTNARGNKGRVSPMKGRKNTEETRKKKSKALKGRSYIDLHGPEKATKLKQNLRTITKGRKPWNKGKSQDRIICLYCNKEGGYAVMKRWHFENCRER